MVQMLVNHGALSITQELTDGPSRLRRSAERLSPLHLALRHMHLDIARYLLRTEVGVVLKSPDLHAAVTSGDGEILERLLDAGLDPNHDSPGLKHVLVTAVNCGNLEMARLLISQGADVNGVKVNDSLFWMQDVTALHQAASKGHFEIAQLLLENSASADKTDPRWLKLTGKQWPTPLDVAISAKHEELQELLVDYGCRAGVGTSGIRI